MRISDWSSDVCSSDLLVGERTSPRASFADHKVTTPWDSQHIIYFSGYAIWTYLTTPFLFARPGFEVQEIDPWDGEGEVWRRLRVKFRSEEHTSELQSLMRISYAVFCLKNKKEIKNNNENKN